MKAETHFIPSQIPLELLNSSFSWATKAPGKTTIITMQLTVYFNFWDYNKRSIAFGKKYFPTSGRLTTYLLCPLVQSPTVI